MCFISSGEAASFLAWLRKQRVEGAINACSQGVVKLSELIGWIEKETGKKAVIAKQVRDEDKSPLGVPDSWVMDTSKAERLGFEFQPLRAWLPALIGRMSAER